ncbi:MAG: acyl--CoA ligase, partial [SAR86 cluster bacterium]|nr:acyl--CoA ligase [SAR86 cluster bacterium]
MTDIFNEVVKQVTAKGQMFETKEVLNDNGVTYTEYANFAENLKQFFDIGLTHEEKDWLVYENERYTYKEVYERSAQVANALIATGIKKGDRVAICMQNNPEYIFSFMGIMGMGAVCVPLNSWWVPSEVIYGLEHSDAKLLIADKKRLQGLESMPDVIKVVTTYADDENFTSFKSFVEGQSSSWPEVEINRNDYASIYYTSGSTGRPKGVLSSQKGILSTMFSWTCYSVVASQIAAKTNPDATPLVSPDLAVLHCVPLFHVTGSHSAFLMSILIGRKIVMMKKWDAGEALKIIEEEQVSDITGVPTQTWELLSHPKKNDYDLSSLKVLGGGGGPRPAEHVKQLDEQFEGRPGIGYGLSETNALATLGNGDEYVNHPSSTGRVVPPLTEIKILDSDWNEVAEGELGEIAIKTPASMIGYWKNDEATKECMNEDGWFRTGDLGKFEGPFLYIVDRVKDMVIRGGENIACPEVEAAIYEHENVLEVCVFGVPDTRLGEIVSCCIYLKPGTNLNQEELSSFLSDKLAPFKIPAEFNFTENKIPRLAS